MDIAKLREQIESRHQEALRAIDVIERYMESDGSNGDIVGIQTCKSRCTPGRTKRTSSAIRKEQLADWLRKNGPSTRTRMMAESGVPTGSLPELLKNPEFVQNDKKEWFVTEAKPEVLEQDAENQVETVQE